MTFKATEPIEIGPRVQPDEIVRPTRVVYRHSENRKLTCRLFPTEARAFDFAAEQSEVIVVQDARETPPLQDQVINRSFKNYGKEKMIAELASFARASNPSPSVVVAREKVKLNPAPRLKSRRRGFWE